MSYYSVKVNVTLHGDTDKPKTVPELYLVESESCTEAQAKVYKDFEEYGNDFEIVSTAKTKIVKVIQ